MKILAIDNSSRTVGYAFYDTEQPIEPECFEVSNKGPVTDLRLVEYHHSLSDILTRYKPTVCVIENPGGIGWSIRILSEFLGVAKVQCQKAGATIVTYAPTSMKKLATGSGKAKKEEVRTAMAKLYPSCVTEETGLDASDAVGLLRAYLVDHGLV